MSNPSSLKGNPASKRMSNANLKARRASSWNAGEQRKKDRNAAQDAAKRRNQDSGTTPWQQAKAARAARRRVDPAVQRRAREYASALS